MVGKKTRSRARDTSDDPSVAAATLWPAVELTGPSKPLLSVPRPGPAGRLPERKASGVLPQFWWLGVHGGAGETSLAQATIDTKAAEHHWPLSDKPVPVVLVCRSNITGLQAAQRAATEWASGSRTSTSVLGLVVVADAPGRLPARIRDFTRIVGGGVPHLWTVPWMEQWRLGHHVPAEELPRTVRTVLDQVRLAASTLPAGTPAT
ncbi:hypothetical protein IV498_14670 [Paenarthrobacter sp. Z7-10]|uniref:DUF6668 family protein n=1 Tax=Paenarthrobacter sp. Z7-10 TaxID=2787635 RepID=UPI0022A96CF8|nr:DUF6668 family protein [Paenarthrobacter sp. Z7-10]MCZ2404386.1 hypothetical protein [Paenarthrobacter sp. Z7-10]